jgi:hypothetical protein
MSFGEQTDPLTAAEKKIQAKNAARPSRAAEPIGPVHPREITKIRDEIGRIRDMLLGGESGAVVPLNDLYSVVDRLDLRFKIHHDPSTKPAAKAKKKGRSDVEIIL